jgi:hypothetical protein
MIIFFIEFSIFKIYCFAYYLAIKLNSRYSLGATIAFKTLKGSLISFFFTTVFTFNIIVEFAGIEKKVGRL